MRRCTVALCALAAIVPAASARADTSAPAGGVAYGAPVGQQLGDRVPLKRGMRGPDVKALQAALTRAGFPTAVDGAFGRGTKRSLRAWERAAGRRANGRVNRGDLPGLRDALGATAAAPAPPAGVATINADGTATPPVGAPQAIVDLFAAANEIATLPYRYGGGHRSFKDTAYDCSGSVGYALHGAGLLDHTVDSTMLEAYGDAGPGTWITIYANADHTFLTVAGVRFDTSGQRDAGTRWQPAERSTKGFVVRHPEGL